MLLSIVGPNSLPDALEAVTAPSNPHRDLRLPTMDVSSTLSVARKGWSRVLEFGVIMAETGKKQC